MEEKITALPRTVCTVQWVCGGWNHKLWKRDWENCSHCCCVQWLSGVDIVRWMECLLYLFSKSNSAHLWYVLVCGLWMVVTSVSTLQTLGLTFKNFRSKLWLCTKQARPKTTSIFLICVYSVPKSLQVYLILWCISMWSYNRKTNFELSWWSDIHLRKEKLHFRSIFFLFPI